MNQCNYVCVGRTDWRLSGLQLLRGCVGREHRSRHIKRIQTRCLRPLLMRDGSSARGLAWLPDGDLCRSRDLSRCILGCARSCMRCLLSPCPAWDLDLGLCTSTCNRFEIHFSLCACRTPLARRSHSIARRGRAHCPRSHVKHAARPASSRTSQRDRPPRARSLCQSRSTRSCRISIRHENGAREPPQPARQRSGKGKEGGWERNFDSHHLPCAEAARRARASVARRTAATTASSEQSQMCLSLDGDG